MLKEMDNFLMGNFPWMDIQRYWEVFLILLMQKFGL